MKVTIQEDELTAVDSLGKVYEINGLLIKKPDNQPPVFYQLNDPLCKACRAKFTTSESVIISGNKINLT